MLFRKRRKQHQTRQKAFFWETFIWQRKRKDGSLFSGRGTWRKEGGVNLSYQQRPCSPLLPPSHSVCSDRSHIKQPAENSARPVCRWQWLCSTVYLLRCVSARCLYSFTQRNIIFFFKRSISKCLAGQIIFTWCNTTHKRYTYLPPYLRNIQNVPTHCDSANCNLITCWVT